MNSIIANKEIETKNIPVEIINEYSQILDYFNLSYEYNGAYLQVGDLDKISNWTFNISVILTQAIAFLHTIIPILIIYKVPFKVIRNKEAIKLLMEGALGYEEIGKVLILFLTENATTVAKDIISLTSKFKGPKVPNSLYLGGTVYASHRILDLTDRNSFGKAALYTKSSTNIHLNEITWPFSELSIVEPPERSSSLLNKTYKSISLLKSDAKGNVIKALYFKGTLRPKYCIIKQAISNMISDEWGRDITDRILWQHFLHNQFGDILNIPKAIDLFKEGNDTYFVMDYLKGICLLDYVNRVYLKGSYWGDLALKTRLQLLDYLLKIISLIELFHKNELVHRDISTSNFLITKGDNIYLIDIELAYSIKLGKPSPPFPLGTAGFISPEQMNMSKPTYKEDIYGLGGVMIELFTGLSPVKFHKMTPVDLTENILFFTSNNDLATVIGASQNSDPTLRPTIKEIKDTVSFFYSNLKAYHGVQKYAKAPCIVDLNDVKSTCIKALNTLASDPIYISNNLWLSKCNTSNISIANTSRAYSAYIGLKEGIGGAIYTLSKAKLLGLNISKNTSNIQAGWNFICVNILENFDEINSGLYEGAAGIALVMSNSINSKLFPASEKNIETIKKIFSLPFSDFNVYNGVSGCGISLIQCKNLLPFDFFKTKLKSIITFLLENQHAEGYWDCSTEKHSISTYEQRFSFELGVPGIIWFLLFAYEQHNDPNLLKAIFKSLKWFKRKLNLTLIGNRAGLGQLDVILKENTSILLTYLKAYEVLKSAEIKTQIETLLDRIPDRIISNNFTSLNGLSNLGEVYLEAYKIFKSAKWFARAEWICNILIRTSYHAKEDSAYWLMDESMIPTADLLVGNSGIIHFLLRYYNPSKIGYRILC